VLVYGAGGFIDMDIPRDGSGSGGNGGGHGGAGGPGGGHGGPGGPGGPRRSGGQGGVWGAPGGGGHRPPDVVVLLKNAGNFYNEFKSKVPSIGIVIVILAVISIGYGSFYTVAPEELGVVKRFGKVVRTAGPGPHFKAPLIETVLKPQVTKVHRIEVGFETIDPGPPARYNPIKKEALMLTGDENIVMVEFIVQYKIDDPEAYLFNIRDQSKALKDASEASMREVVGKNPIDEVLTEGRFQVQQEAKQLLQDTMNSYDSGITIVAVQLQDVLPPDQVVNAFKDVASAREDREKSEEQAQGYRNDLIPKAKGEAEKIVNEAMAYKEAKINQAKGDASRFLQVLKEYRKAKEVTRQRIYVETMQEVLGRMETVVISGAAEKNLMPYLPIGRERPVVKGGAK